MGKLQEWGCLAHAASDQGKARRPPKRTTATHLVLAVQQVGEGLRLCQPAAVLAPASALHLLVRERGEVVSKDVGDVVLQQGLLTPGDTQGGGMWGGVGCWGLHTKRRGEGRVIHRDRR